MRIKIITTLLAATVALTACGGTAEESRDTAAEETSQEAAAEEPSADELKKDVEIVACDGTSAPKVTLKVTNSLDEPMEYYGTIDFRDASGQSVADGLFNTGTLAPGASSTEEIPGANVYTAVEGLTCEVVEVKLDEPA